MQRRIPIAAALVAALATPVGAVLSTPSGAGAATRRVSAPANRARLTDFACHSALAPAKRKVSVTAVMRPVPGTRQLSMRLTLLEQPDGSARAHATPPAPDLGKWVTPKDPTLGQRPRDVWRLIKPVSQVSAPAHYRFRVAFRWRGADGKLLAVATRQTRRCTVRELRPDVAVQRVTVSPVAADPGRDRYVALIVNHGATASGRFQTMFTPSPGTASQTRQVPSLRHGASRRETFTGPACNPADPPTIVADPSGRVDDFDRANNTVTVDCPGAA